jgi:membrane-bound ClpP family serine protease
MKLDSDCVDADGFVGCAGMLKGWDNVAMRGMVRLLLLISITVFFCCSCFGAETMPRGPLWGPLPVDYWVAVLLVGGFILMFAELQIVSYGIMGLAGSACLIAAVFILVRYDRNFFGIPPIYLVPVIMAMMAIFAFLGFLGARVKNTANAAGPDSFVGQEAEVIKDLTPSGKVLFQGSYWNANSAVPARAGTKVKILASERMCLIVEPLD